MWPQYKILKQKTNYKVIGEWQSRNEKPKKTTHFKQLSDDNVNNSYNYSKFLNMSVTSGTWQLIDWTDIFLDEANLTNIVFSTKI